jgi:hypothetical protein
MTHALLPGSPAINGGDPVAVAGVGVVPMSDQRGAPYTRVYGGRIDMGAFELQPTDYVLGDFNREGNVDSADYAVWRREMGSTVAPGTGADGNGDGIVNEADFVLWRSNFGHVYGPPAAAIAAEQADVVPSAENNGPTVDDLPRVSVDEQQTSTASRADIPTSPTPPAKPRGAARLPGARPLPRRVELADDALAAWVASRLPARLAEYEPAAERIARDHAAESATQLSSKVTALDVVFASLGAVGLR